MILNEVLPKIFATSILPKCVCRQYHNTPYSLGFPPHGM
jgi:hypothetical protein